MDSKHASNMAKLTKKAPEESVKVVVRCRPLSEAEINGRNEKIVKVHPEKGVIEVLNPKMPGITKQFTFDTVFDESARQIDLYDESFRALVESVLHGFNGTIFAYGETGAGKTYTMEGLCVEEDRDTPSHSLFIDEEKRGVIPNAFEHIFNHIEDSPENIEYLVSASYFEIYQEEIRDLLSETKTVKTCEVREKPGEGAYVKDLTVKVCRNKLDLENAFLAGKKKRSIGATNMNLHSSRSHAIFMLTIEQCELEQQERMRIGKLNLVDLAGSERLSKTGAVGQRQKESIKINLSLSALGNVISALVDGTSSHIPYRDSKLTRLLQDSLGGNSKTIMVANIGPADHNYEETLQTLRYANRAKNIKNTPVVNEDPKDALLKKYKEEIERLKAELAAKMKKKKGEKKEEKKSTLSDEEDYDSAEISEEELLRQERSHTEILSDQHTIAEEKERLLNELNEVVKEKEELLSKENEAKQSLLNKIKSLEGQLLSGGKNIIDRTNEYEKQLKEKRKELAETKSREREIMRKLEEEEETTLEIKETYSNLRQEVDIKTKKLKKLFVKLQALKREIHEESEINSREREDKERIADTLMRQLKFTHLVIENFVPPEDKAKILKHVKFDEDENLWFYLSKPHTIDEPVAKPTSADVKGKRPVADYARQMYKLTSSPRYISENIAMIDLDYAVLSVTDYQPPDVDPVHRALMDDAFNNEKDSVIDASDPKFRCLKKSARRRSRIKTCRRRVKDEKEREEANYPAPRGLVPRY